MPRLKQEVKVKCEFCGVVRILTKESVREHMNKRLYAALNSAVITDGNEGGNDAAPGP
jgi:hypothetical protein